MPASGMTVYDQNTFYIYNEISANKVHAKWVFWENLQLVQDFDWSLEQLQLYKKKKKEKVTS